MNERPYMREHWFQLLSEAAQRLGKAEVARRLGVSAPVVVQVTNGSGQYGSGGAGTGPIALKVMHTFGRYVCPHLTEQHGHERLVTAEQCRNYAHREPPTSSPRELAHWQACNGCHHKPLSAPPQPRTPKPRKARLDSELPPTAAQSAANPAQGELL